MFIPAAPVDNLKKTVYMCDFFVSRYRNHGRLGNPEDFFRKLECRESGTGTVMPYTSTRAKSSSSERERH